MILGTNAGMPWKVGDLCLFHGRLAEILTLGGGGGVPMVEVTDAGGNRWDYVVRAYSRFTPLQFEDETVLDALQRAAAEELTEREQLRRMAELWLADPQVGDVFLVEDGYLLELTDMWEDGVILATQHPHKHSYPLREMKETSFDSDRQLRQWLALPHGPAYRAAAYATSRPDFQGHELLVARISRRVK